MSNRSAFIFDMDGVLTDNMRHHADSWVELFRDYGLEGMDTERYLVETAGMKGHDVLRYFLDPDISATEADRLTELKDFVYRVNSRSMIRPLKGLEGFLAKAADSGIAMAIGTGAGHKNIDFVLDILHMRSSFGAIVSASDVARGKPDPDVFLRAAELLNVPPSSCIVFEDAIPGLEAARSAGMAAVAVTTTNSREAFNPFGNVIAVIDDFTALDPIELVRNIPASNPLTSP
ncbi:MAG TPA: beta-phosphoglucomutase family hydrolase [Chlorobium sp.]|uniref:Beta-phosphoglucomutase family hydrolase n=1 Tax=Chlorobium phaeovibrioides (strain DSM 265 / 1930) TaxID=290318 RepID=A4SGY2_CHLPM|nr:beta-phosphoglucomutase family hydrolase [Chlorobium sp.]